MEKFVRQISQVDLDGRPVIAYRVTDFPLDAIPFDDMMSDGLPNIIGVPEPLLLQLWQARTRLQYDAGEYLGDYELAEDVDLKFFMPETWLKDPEAALTPENMRGAHVNGLYGPTGSELPFPGAAVAPIIDPESGSPTNGTFHNIGGQPFFLPLPSPSLMGNSSHMLFGWGPIGGDGQGFVCHAWPGWERAWQPLSIEKLQYLRSLGIYEGDPGCSYGLDYSPNKDYEYFNEIWKVTGDRSLFSQTTCGAANADPCLAQYKGFYTDLYHGLPPERLDWIIMGIIRANPAQFPKFTRPFFSAVLCRHSSNGSGGMGFEAYQRLLSSPYGNGGFGYPYGKRVGAGPGAAVAPLIPSILTVGAGAAAVSAVFARLPQLLRGQQ